MRKNIIVTLVVAVLTLWTTPGLAVDIYVPADQPTIQAGIDAAVDGDIVLVAPGTYAENGIKFFGKAITVKSESGPEVTVVDGATVPGYTLFFFNYDEGSNSVLQGFTLENADFFDGNGGAISCQDSSPTIIDNVIRNNRSPYRGGGIYCYGGAPTICGNTISGNTAPRGGGIYCEYSSPAIIDNNILSNDSDYGGGIQSYEGSNVVATGNYVSDNTGQGFHFDYSSVVASNNIVSNNTAGGLAFYSCYADVEINSNFVSGNGNYGIYCLSTASPITNNTICDNDGFGIQFNQCHYPSSFLVANNIIFNNSFGIYCFDSDFSIVHNTIADNQINGLYVGGSPVPTVTNTILFGVPEEPVVAVDPGASPPIITYSDVQGGWPGEGNIDADPLFARGGYYHLIADSPCVDAGIDIGIYTDIDGDERPFGAGFDMGADEYVAPPEFILELGATYSSGFLNLDFRMGLPGPAYWANFMLVTAPDVQLIPLWARFLDPLDPPLSFDVFFPCPSLGEVGVYSGLFTDQGIQASQFVWVDTAL